MEEDSPTLREQLRKKGFDFLVRRPVHPTALRLLVLRALYRGPERRREARFPIGAPVNYTVEGGKFSGVLSELSQKGCRLFVNSRVNPGTQIDLYIDPEQESRELIHVVGKVLRTTSGENWENPGEIAVAMVFEHGDSNSEELIVEYLSRREVGPITAVPDDEISQEADQGAERRVAARAGYRELVISEGNAGNRALIGRDISVGGMRVEPHPCLGIGDQLKLAIYADGHDDAILVTARVARDDGERGLGIAFEELEPEAIERLEKFVSGLPAVETLSFEETEGLGTVISEMLQNSEN